MTQPFTAFVLEDSLIALDLEAMLLGFGAAAVDLAATLSEADAVLAQRAPDVAFLEVQIAAQSSLSLAARLIAAGIPVVLTTGSVLDSTLPDPLQTCRIVEKPYSPHHIEVALRQALKRLD